MKPRKTAENTFVYDIPMLDVPMDGIDVKQGGECVYGKQHFIVQMACSGMERRLLVIRVY